MCVALPQQQLNVACPALQNYRGRQAKLVFSAAVSLALTVTPLCECDWGSRQTANMRERRPV